jgi:hypothetical protein
MDQVGEDKGKKQKMDNGKGGWPKHKTRGVAKELSTVRGPPHFQRYKSTVLSTILCVTNERVLRSSLYLPAKDQTVSQSSPEYTFFQSNLQLHKNKKRKKTKSVFLHFLRAGSC